MLKSLTQRYSSYKYRKDDIRLPLLVMRVTGPNGISFRTSALVDSGATVTFIETEIAELLELPHEKEEIATGAGGNFKNWISHVDIEVLKGTRIACSMKDTPVYVPMKVGTVPYCVLGRDSIFEHYNITFQEGNGRFIMRRPKR